MLSKQVFAYVLPSMSVCLKHTIMEFGVTLTWSTSSSCLSKFTGFLKRALCAPRGHFSHFSYFKCERNVGLRVKEAAERLSAQ